MGHSDYGEPRCRRSGEDSTTARLGRHLGAVPGTELPIDVAEVVPDGLLADPEPGGELPVLEALGNERQHLELARGQAGLARRVGRVRGEVEKELLRDVVEEGLAARDVARRLGEPLRVAAVALDDAGARSDRHAPARELAVRGR